MEAKISIMGLYNWDNTIFDNMNFPSFTDDDDNIVEFSDEDKNVTIANLLSECAGLEILYPNPNIMKQMIEAWSYKECLTWNRLFRLMMEKYDPLENYHRTEHHTQTLDHSDTHSGTDSNQASGTDSGNSTDTNSGTDTTTGQMTGYDSGVLVDHDKTSLSHGHVLTNYNSMTYGRKDSLTHGEKITYGGTIKNDTEAFGNIGVTSSQQMAEQEYSLAPKMNIANYIIDSFKNRFCLLVW